MFGNGALITGTTIMTMHLQMVVRGSMIVVIIYQECCAAAPGSITRGSAGRPAGTGGIKTTAPTALVSAFVLLALTNLLALFINSRHDFFHFFNSNT
jgi:hypothetical protein